jgi:histidinol dehydrogenase
VCWRKSVPIEKAGLYIPGGSAPLFSTVLMLGIPAKLAGCSEIIICTPPGKDGKVNPLILYTATLIGINNIYSVGGAQAIGAMAYGTESIPKVSKIFGPGNQYVTKAKEMVQQDGIAIDMPAGPSEVLIIADSSANPGFVAADLLSQAEHGPDSQVIMLTNDEALIEKVKSELEDQLSRLPRRDTATKAIAGSRMILLSSLDDCICFSNNYAPEHLIINTSDPVQLAERVVNAGSVFLGRFSCESAGDYASGTNHTLPTNGFARSYSGVSVDSFLKKITFQEISREGIRSIGPAIELMADAESLQAHKNAVTIRLKSIQNG